ncbi:hypothetical protein [Halobaculum rarum]|uniref:hypothetical protein n=1 Tax=Halobaculum rarum TaxID=3075122 RepID=UPI0032AF9E92
MTTDNRGIINSLPPRPVLESTIDRLATHEKVGEWESTLAYYQPEVGEELVFNFMIEVSGEWCALVLHEDGESGWKILGTYERFGDAGRSISNWREDNNIY